MSEYQLVAFRAIDGPVSGKNLEYMERQSSRAKITPWSFDNEYSYSSFGGNTIEMLRRGYDFHLDFSNYGNRKLMIRLPNGLPDPVAAKPYFVKGAFEYKKDPSGPGGILSLDPFFEELDYVSDLEEMIDELIPLRAEILNGDLRPFYLANLIARGDDNHDPEEFVEGPVPAGLGKPTEAQRALLEFYDFSEYVIAAAARKSLPLPNQDLSTKSYGDWIQNQSEATKNTWLTELLSNPNSSVRRDIVAAYQKDCQTSAWPTERVGRTIQELLDAEEEIAEDHLRKAAANAQMARSKKLAKMATDPAESLKKTEDLLSHPCREAFNEIAELLTDLREALMGTEHEGLAERQAEKLTASNPNLTRLIGALRKAGFVPKKKSPPKRKGS